MKENKLIAEFMGYVNTTPTDKDFNIYEHPETKKLIETMSMQFHTSWDWLMPVVEKINVMVSTTSDDYDVQLQYDKTLGELPTMCSNIDWVYKAVVEFIKWYNKQKEGDE